jgi:hypothetical protein
VARTRIHRVVQTLRHDLAKPFRVAPHGADRPIAGITSDCEQLRTFKTHEFFIVEHTNCHEAANALELLRQNDDSVIEVLAIDDIGEPSVNVTLWREILRCDQCPIWKSVSVGPSGDDAYSLRRPPEAMVIKTMSRSQDESRADQRTGTTSPPAVSKVATEMTDGVPWEAGRVDLVYAAVTWADNCIIDCVAEIVQQIDFRLRFDLHSQFNPFLALFETLRIFFQRCCVSGSLFRFRGIE